MLQDQHAVAAAGDKLRDLIERALLALSNEDLPRLRQILDDKGHPAVRAWDLARGREVPSQYDFSPPASAETQ